MRKSMLLPLLLASLTIGCASSPKNVEMILPEFPAPSEEAIDDLQKCASPAIDAWVDDLAKLCQKLNKDC